MISPDDVQATIISALKAYAPLVAVLPEGMAGIRESQWKGTGFQYPNVRVQRITMSPYGDGNCAPITQHVQFTVVALSKKDSSKTAQAIQGLVMQALDGFRLGSATVNGIVPIRLQQQTPVTPDETEIWNGAVTFRTIVKDGPSAASGGGGSSPAEPASIQFVIDGGGAIILPGIKGDIPAPFAGTISEVELLADQIGDIVVDIWKDTYAAFPPTVADSITAATPPTITADDQSIDAVLTGWTTSLALGDVLRYNVDSCNGIKRVTIALKVRP